MDEHNNDPYEQQLYAVFQSCLRKGETELQEDNWLSLCHKLHLTEQSEELKSCIQQHKQEKQFISFQEFRAALLTLLGKTQDSITQTDKDCITESQNDINSHIIDNKRCNSLPPNNSSSNVDFLNGKTDAAVDENRLKCLWEKINTCLKENVDSATMFFISNCLGIPALPKQISQCIFEKLDQNCDGLISLDEFLIIFENKAMENQVALDKNNEPANELTKLDFRKRNFDIHTPRKTSFTRNNTFLDTWKFSNITNTSLLMDGGLKTSEISLTDLTTTLCDELKNFNDSLDHSAIRSHIMLLRDVLILYQKELHSLNLMIENINGEKEKLRTDIIEANDRVNTLVQEIDEQHIRQEEIVQNLRKQIEQRHTEIVQDLSNQLSSEREMSASVVKSKDDQIQVLQKENHEIKNKFVSTLQENQVLETENENLHSQIEKLKQSNNELLTQIKVLAAEHDESENIEAKHQQEVIYLVDRIKQLQSEAVLLRDQNDELTAELESFKLRDRHNKDISYCRQNNLPGTHIIRNTLPNEIENKETFAVEEDDLDVVLKHSTFLSCNSNEEDNIQNYKKIDLKQFKDIVLKQLKNILINNNKCTIENCAFKDEISGMIMRLQSNLNTQIFKETEFVKSIASEIETECEERTSESLRDFVVPKHKNSVSIKRAITSNSNDDNCDVDNFSQDTKNSTQNKVSSLRDYPPRKEEHLNIDSKLNKEKDVSVIQSLKITTEIGTRCNSSLIKSESSEDVFLHLKLKELEATHATEKKQLIEQCAELERSLDMLKIEYEECEDYWTAKLEEERQLFEQEQKISDEKFSELIAKMAEYEELISPIDKVKNGGRLSPIEEKFNLEQQYLDLEEEFEKWKAQMEEEMSQKDKEIQDFHEKIKSLERPLMTDMSIQVTDDFIFPPLLTRSNYVPNDLFNVQPSSDSVSKLAQCSDNIRNLSEEFKFNRILESSIISNDFISPLTKDDIDSGNCDQYSTKSVNNTYKIEKPDLQWKTIDDNGKIAKEENIHSAEYDYVQNTLKLQHLKAPTCQCMRNDSQVGCININILQNLSTKLQVQERKKHQLQEWFKQQQYHTEHVLQHIMSQHQVEISELQCLLRSTQEKLQIEFQTNAEQAEQLARTDILVKDLYIENACLITNLKRLRQHYNMLTGLNAESTSI